VSARPSPNGAAAPADRAGPAAALRRAASERAGRVDLLVLHVGAELFAVPLAASVEVVRLDGAGDAITVRGETVSLVDAAGALGVTTRMTTSVTPSTAAVVRAGDGVLALVVDAAVPVHGAELSGVRAVPWPDDGALLGVLPRGDTVVALVDVDALASLVAAGASAPPSASLIPARA
jgi:chemotaxis signal transduction protein